MGLGVERLLGRGGGGVRPAAARQGQDAAVAIHLHTADAIVHSDTTMQHAAHTLGKLYLAMSCAVRQP